MRSLAMANATPVIISLAAFSRYVPRSQCQLQRGLCGSCNVCGPTEILNQNCAHSTSSSHFVCRVELMKMAARHGTARLGKQRWISSSWKSQKQCGKLITDELFTHIFFHQLPKHQSHSRIPKEDALYAVLKITANTYFIFNLFTIDQPAIH